VLKGGKLRCGGSHTLRVGRRIAREHRKGGYLVQDSQGLRARVPDLVFNVWGKRYCHDALECDLRDLLVLFRVLPWSDLRLKDKGLVLVLPGD
jgi:hypothetical protein